MYLAQQQEQDMLMQQQQQQQQMADEENMRVARQGRVVRKQQANQDQVAYVSAGGQGAVYAEEEEGMRVVRSNQGSNKGSFKKFTQQRSGSPNMAYQRQR